MGGRSASRPRRRSSSGSPDPPPAASLPARQSAASRTGHVLREQVAAELARQRRLVERMQALSDAAASLLDTLRCTDRAAWEGRERRAAPG